MLSELLSSFDDLAKRKGITLCGQWPDDLPVIRAGRQRIAQVLGNLIDNAIKHAGKNSTIILRAAVEARSLFYKGEDNGSGITEEHLEGIFQPYHKVNHINGNYEGMGLGLALSKMFIELH